MFPPLTQQKTQGATITIGRKISVKRLHFRWITRTVLQQFYVSMLPQSLKSSQLFWQAPRGTPRKLMPKLPGLPPLRGVARCGPSHCNIFGVYQVAKTCSCEHILEYLWCPRLCEKNNTSYSISVANPTVWRVANICIPMTRWLGYLAAQIHREVLAPIFGRRRQSRSVSQAATFSRREWTHLPFALHPFLFQFCRCFC